MKKDFLEAQAMEIAKENGQEYNELRFEEHCERFVKERGERFNDYFWHDFNGPMKKNYFA